MKLVIIESPYAGDVEANLAYVRAAMVDALGRGEAPYASHALYTQPGVLRDELPNERKKGIEAGFAWGRRADMRVLYIDRGLSAGMAEGVIAAARIAQPVHVRILGHENALAFFDQQLCDHARADWWRFAADTFPFHFDNGWGGTVVRPLHEKEAKA
jgi:hypothetical protein